MRETFRHHLLPLLAAVLAVPGSARAGWVTIQNDTPRVVVIQGSVPGPGLVRRCKPVRLLPGECVREYHAGPTLTLDVFDGQNRTSALCAENLALTAEKQSFAVATDGHKIHVSAVPRR